MYPTAPHRTLKLTGGSSQVFEGNNSPKAFKDNQQNHKKWNKNTIKDLKQVCPKQAHDFLS